MITNNIKIAETALLRNDLVAIPTETVYGLAGNAFNDSVIKKIFELKKRPYFNPLIVHIKSMSALDTVAIDIPPIAYQLADIFWPGPLTLLLKKQSVISDLVTAGKPTVAVRVPHHETTLKLLNNLPFPLAAPSANPFGSISPTSPFHVEAYFGSDLEVILDGGICKKGIESTIIGFNNQQPILYRHGAISIEEIEEKVGKIKVVTKNNNDPSAPGMLSKHYAPATKTILTENITKTALEYQHCKIGLLLFNKRINIKTAAQKVLSEKGDLKEAAKNLYATLHDLDKLNLDIIIAEKMPNNGLGLSINDRLERAIK